jgi:hypothetical protein
MLRRERTPSMAGCAPLNGSTLRDEDDPIFAVVGCLAYVRRVESFEADEFAGLYVFLGAHENIRRAVRSADRRVAHVRRPNYNSKDDIVCIGGLSGLYFCSCTPDNVQCVFV